MALGGRTALLAILLIGAFVENRARPQDFIKDLNSQLSKLQSNVERQVAALTSNIPSKISKLQQQINSSIGSFAAGSGSVSSSVVSGYANDGSLYYKISEERIDKNNILEHVDRVLDANMKPIHEYKYTLDLNNPSAKPVVASTNF